MLKKIKNGINKLYYKMKLSLTPKKELKTIHELNYNDLIGTPIPMDIS